MAKIAAEALIERLADWGVDTVFGLPGDGINGIMEGLRRHDDRIRFVLVHHEEAAAFMATAYAKTTGRLGVCLATSGPGAIHLLNGLYDAKLDHAPVLAITGMQESQMLGTGYQQEVTLDHLYMDVAEYNQMIHVPVQVPTLVDLAVRHALSRRTVSHLTMPTDIQVADAGSNPYGAPAPAVIKPRRRSTCRLRASPDRAISSGRRGPQRRRQDRDARRAGARHARAEVLEVAELLGSPIVKTLAGKAVVPDDTAHDRRHRSARTAPSEEADGRLRHPVHGRHELPVHEVPTRARPGHRRPDRSGPGARRQPPADGGAARRGRQGDPGRHSSRC